MVPSRLPSLWTVSTLLRVSPLVPSSSAQPDEVISAIHHVVPGEQPPARRHGAPQPHHRSRLPPARRQRHIQLRGVGRAQGRHCGLCRLVRRSGGYVLGPRGRQHGHRPRRSAGHRLHGCREREGRYPRRSASAHWGWRCSRSRSLLTPATLRTFSPSWDLASLCIYCKICCAICSLVGFQHLLPSASDLNMTFSCKFSDKRPKLCKLARESLNVLRPRRKSKLCIESDCTRVSQG